MIKMIKIKMNKKLLKEVEGELKQKKEQISHLKQKISQINTII